MPGYHLHEWGMDCRRGCLDRSSSPTPTARLPPPSTHVPTVHSLQACPGPTGPLACLCRKPRSQGCRTGQTCQHTRLKKSRPRSWACLILPSGAVSVGQGVPLLSQGLLLPQCLNSCSAECPCLKMGVSLIPRGTRVPTVLHQWPPR